MKITVFQAGEHVATIEPDPPLRAVGHFIEPLAGADPTIDRFQALLDAARKTTSEFFDTGAQEDVSGDLLGRLQALDEAVSLWGPFDQDRKAP